MFVITLKNGKSFSCDESSTVLEAAKTAGITLEHSCLSARCRSCMVKVDTGATIDVNSEFVLSEKEKNNGFILSCNAIPLSNLDLDVEDLGNVDLVKSRTIPCKISLIDRVSVDVIKLILRLPPTANFKFLPGQYVNLIKGNISRSYSIASHPKSTTSLEFFIKNYNNGKMSDYWFHSAKNDDVLRLQGPLGTFFLRNKPNKNLIFLATGTGIAPINSILEELKLLNLDSSKVTVVWGVRDEKSLFLDSLPFVGTEFYKVVSRPTKEWGGKIGYVQDVLISLKDDLSDCVVYACGSNEMIDSSRTLLISNGLDESDFYSDAFVSSN
ncbi:MAG: FAD-binding oxidoreductase [Maribacter sp.]